MEREKGSARNLKALLHTSLCSTGLLTILLVKEQNKGDIDNANLNITDNNIRRQEVTC